MGYSKETGHHYESERQDLPSNPSAQPQLGELLPPPRLLPCDVELCKWISFFIPVFGLIISAIIGRGTGVRAGLKGVWMRFVVMFFIGVVVGLVASCVAWNDEITQYEVGR